MMNEKDYNELDALIDACLDGRLSGAESDRLSQLIEESSKARQRYWELASVHGMIEQSMQSASLKAATGEEFVTPVKMEEERFRWSRISSTAAGILIGIFSASVVWAYAVPRVNQPHRESREIVFESFEESRNETAWAFSNNRQSLVRRNAFCAREGRDAGSRGNPCR